MMDFLAYAHVYSMWAAVSTCVLTCVYSAHVCMYGKRLTIGVFLNFGLFYILRQALSLADSASLASRLILEFLLCFLFSGSRQASILTQLLNTFLGSELGSAHLGKCTLLTESFSQAQIMKVYKRGAGSRSRV